MYVHWFPDGTGRDAYIHSNNGGFTVLSHPNQYDKPGTMRYKSIQRSNSKNIGALLK
jgi:hypothetical protein